MTTVSHPRVRPGVLEDRLYQEHIAATAIDHNTLAVLPTGLGKTAIALRVIAEYLRRQPTKSVLFLAPTRPLVVQHARSVGETIFGPAPIALTGTVPPDRRSQLLAPPQIVVATPQVIGNDLLREGLDLGTFSLIVFDEAHRAVGDYPYVAIGQANRAGPNARVLALTASPGSRIERIRAVWGNLGIERFEYRTAFDPDVREYVHGVGIETVEVPVPPEVRHLAILIRTALTRQTQALHHRGLLPTPDGSRRDLLALGERLRHEVGSARRRVEPVPGDVWWAVTAHAIAMKAIHALELIETQGVEALRGFLDRQSDGPKGRPTPSARGFLNDPDLVQVKELLRQLTVEHPKIAKAVQVVRAEIHRAPESRVILFAQYRQTAETLVAELSRLDDPRIRPARFVGQASRGADEGLSQKEQVDLLDRFRHGEVNVLVATSVAEEGLDVPSTDLVIFYEPVPDVIRTIQRRGRTGRARAGRAVVLVAEGTRDATVNRGAGARERRMHAMLEQVEEEARRGEIPTEVPRRQVQKELDEF